MWQSSKEKISTIKWGNSDSGKYANQIGSGMFGDSGTGGTGLGLGFSTCNTDAIVAPVTNGVDNTGLNMAAGDSTDYTPTAVGSTDLGAGLGLKPLCNCIFAYTNAMIDNSFQPTGATASGGGGSGAKTAAAGAGGIAGIGSALA